jgi:hypothetical protein
MINKLTAAALAVPVLSLFLATGCGSQPSHPNQINALDGATYDTMTLAHGALTSLRAQVSFSYPKYVPVFNQAAAAYGPAFNAYAAFRTNPSDQAEMGVEIDNLTVSIIALENAFQTDMNVSASTVAQVEKQAKKLRQSISDRVTVSDILTELEIAAAVARTVPAAAPYAALAQVVITSTSEALAAEIAAAGQPIDLTTIQPIAAIQQ